jgi:SAM-dependent methyltransferase
MTENNGNPARIITSTEITQNYSLPEIYDIAFSFRDVPDEVDFLLEATQKYSARKITSAIELACGPGYHTREIAKRSLVSDGLDLSPDMVAYTRSLIQKELLRAEIFEGDMRCFRAAKKYDLAYLLMASFAQLLTNQDILDNFNCVADLLSDGGIYIIETAHPRDFFGEEEPSVKHAWQISRGDITVETNWGGDDQQFNPLTDVDDILVSYTVTTPDGITRYECPDKYRRCSLTTFQALVKLSGRFEIAAMFGGFDLNLPLTNDRACWRFIPVLRKIR